MLLLHLLNLNKNNEKLLESFHLLLKTCSLWQAPDGVMSLLSGIRICRQSWARDLNTLFQIEGRL